MLIEKAFDETERYKLCVTDHEFERAAAENDNRISRDGRSLICGHTRAYFSYPHGLAA